MVKPIDGNTLKQAATYVTPAAAFALLLGIVGIILNCHTSLACKSLADASYVFTAVGGAGTLAGISIKVGQAVSNHLCMGKKDKVETDGHAEQIDWIAEQVHITDKIQERLATIGSLNFAESMKNDPEIHKLLKPLNDAQRKLVTESVLETEQILIGLKLDSEL